MIVHVVAAHRKRDHGAATPSDPHEVATGMFVIALLFVGITVVILVTGPRSSSPPPPAVPWFTGTVALLFGFISFFVWRAAESAVPAMFPGTTPPKESQ